MVLEMRLKNYNIIILESQRKTEPPSVSELNVTEKTKHAATELLGGPPESASFIRNADA